MLYSPVAQPPGRLLESRKETRELMRRNIWLSYMVL
jgi:hypothetical protein